MTTTTAPKLMPELPRPGQKVRWRNRRRARVYGWEDLFGPGPYEVVGLVDRSNRGLATNIVLRTNMGEREIPEVGLAVADEPEDGTSGWRGGSDSSSLSIARG
jgi:hypothetical protein